MSQLTAAQERFAFLVAELESASEAYRRTYPRSRCWKPEAVHVAASKLLARTKVAVRVEELREAKRAEFEAEVRRQGIQPADVIREQGHVGFFDPADLFDDDGQPLSIDRLPESTRRGLRTYKSRCDEDGNILFFEFVAADKLRALRDIGDHLGMYRQAHEHRSWAEGLRDLSEEQLVAEQQRIEAELERALAERDEARRH